MASLFHIPNEVFYSITSLLPNRDIKNLRLTCTRLSSHELRLDRVFLSPHPRDIEIFMCIASHDSYRGRIVELIYDDARFRRRVAHRSIGYDLDEDDPLDTHPAISPDRVIDGVPEWFICAYDDIQGDLEREPGRYITRPDHVEVAKQLESRLSIAQSYSQYQRIVDEQNETIAISADSRALQYGLKQFPCLRKVTLTAVAHGLTFRPKYETPFIRSLPYGFIYPIPRGWPESRGVLPFAVTTKAWDADGVKEKWRGLRVLLRALVTHSHSVTEFVVDVNQILTGISLRIFDNPNEEYEDLVSLVRRPNFSRFDLALFAGDPEQVNWPSYRNGLLYNMFMEAKDVQHVRLTTDLDPPEDIKMPAPYGTDGSEYFLPLRSLFPVHQWTQLRHFGLARFIVKQDDLTSFLADMPPTLRSVELSFLSFIRIGGGSYLGLLLDMREKLKWHERHTSERPKLTIFVDIDPPLFGRYVDISTEAEAVVYKNGKTPFADQDYPELDSGNSVYRDLEVGIERNMFNSADDCPFAEDDTLVKLGVYTEFDWPHPKPYLKNL
ncbi:hypothetical protein B0I35DRAFT_441726 [Stachybotrys elegans]|uniref:F-box domain-containing protein n=1 Tax=Stachybotrys elegans TaxID=80388 RepID=A0A8K0SIT0_9HYPO|nr:hypothetical protein B0I35DRAFT_441726 [Stachybotrys elegans]